MYVCMCVYVGVYIYIFTLTTCTKSWGPDCNPQAATVVIGDKTKKTNIHVYIYIYKTHPLRSNRGCYKLLHLVCVQVLAEVARWFCSKCTRRFGHVGVSHMAVAQIQRARVTQVLVHVSTCQGNPFWYRFFEPQPYWGGRCLVLGNPVLFCAKGKADGQPHFWGSSKRK